MTVTTTTTVTEAPYPAVKRIQRTSSYPTPFVHKKPSHSPGWSSFNMWTFSNPVHPVSRTGRATTITLHPSSTSSPTSALSSSSPSSSSTHHFAILPRTLVTRAIPAAATATATAAAAAPPPPAIAEPRDDDAYGAFRGLSLPLTEDVKEDDATIFLPMDVGIGAEEMERVELSLPEEEGEEVVF